MNGYTEVVLECLLFLGMVLSTVALVVPVFPGFLVMWLLALGYLLWVGWQGWNLVFFIVLTLLALAGTLADNIVVAMRASQGGAGWLSIVLAWLAGVLAWNIVPPLGSIAAALVVFFLVESIRHRNLAAAWRGFKAYAKGYGWAVLARLGLGFLMIAIWLLWALTT